MCVLVFFIINVFHAVTSTTCSNVAGVIEIEIQIALSKCPNTNVKFSTFVKERTFNVLLDNPIGKLYTCFKESVNLFFITKYSYSFSLVFVGRLDKPCVQLALFLWHFFFDRMEIFFG
jgi:hypothetical protein